MSPSTSYPLNFDARETHSQGDGHEVVASSSALADLDTQVTAITPADEHLGSTPTQRDEQRDLHPDGLSDDEVSTDVHRTDLKSYMPWFPKRDNPGILSGIHGSALILFGASTMAVGMLSVFILVIYTAMGLRSTIFGTPMQITISYFLTILDILRGSVNWLPVLLTYAILSRDPKTTVWLRGLAIASGILVFGLLAWVNYILPIHVEMFRSWKVWNLPQSFRGCNSRVAYSQASLFNAGRIVIDESNQTVWPEHVFSRGIYHVQFDRIHVVMESSLNWFENVNYTLFHDIRANQTLCDQGFRGDSDYYGLGIRGGLYLQWLASSLANHFLPHSQGELQRFYLVFMLAISIATVVTTFSESCIFSIEIEIFYWMYWGGYMSVFGSAPDPVEVTSGIQWVPLDWTTAILFMTNMTMTYHSIWFFWYAYDNVFARMPCGTYQFLLAPLLDPSERFGRVRDLLMTWGLIVVVPLAIVFPFIVALLATEIKHTIQNSGVLLLIFHRLGTFDNMNSPLQTSQAPSFGFRMYQQIKKVYYGFRESIGLPSHARQGIRLVTSIDLKHRRQYRIQCALLGISACILAISAIELTISWNNIVGVNSLIATGQYISLTIGAGTVISVLWRLMVQESERVRASKVRQRLQVDQDQDQDDEAIELRSFSDRVSTAVSHAFSQRDAGFLRDGGVLPEPQPQETGHLDRPRDNIYVMSGALPDAVLSV